MKDAELVVYSSAIKAGNIAYDEAEELWAFPWSARADALAAIMNSRRASSICGMHGKTTTSSMTAHVLRSGGLKPSHYVGAEIPILGSECAMGFRRRVFRGRRRRERRHADQLPSRARHRAATSSPSTWTSTRTSRRSMRSIPSSLRRRGARWSIAGTTRAPPACARAIRGAISYGHAEGQYLPHHRSRCTKNFRSHFTVWKKNERLGEITLNIPGAHNALNALAVIALTTELGVPFARHRHGVFDGFRGAKRRFEIRHESPRNLVVDDYGYHPTEIAATIATARTGDWKRVLVMFQPHRYTRTPGAKRRIWPGL